MRLQGPAQIRRTRLAARTPAAQQSGPRAGTAEAPVLLVSSHEAARILGIGKTTLYQLIATGALTPIHIGRCVRFPVHELEAFVHRRVAEAS